MGPYLSAISENAKVYTNGDYLVTRCGSLISENVKIGARVILRPGTIVGHGALISDMKLIQEEIPESSLVL